MAETSLLTTDADLTPSQLDDKKLLKRIRERLALMIEGDKENRDEAKEDLRFVSIPGAQWDPDVKISRGTRPCYEFDKISVKGKRLINEMRANRPAGKVRATKDSAKSTADVMEGLCRNIANVSDLDTIADYAGVYQVEAGMGAWRVTTEYIQDAVRQQRIRAEPIPNPFCLYWDPASVDPLKRDAEDWCLINDMSRNAYTKAYGKKARKVSFTDGECEADADWDTKDTTRVCEYWYKEPYQKKLWLLKDGKTVDADAPVDAAKPNGQKYRDVIRPDQIEDQRTADCDAIMMCIASGDAILEGPTKQAGRNHRFIVVHGEWKMVDGKALWHGIVRKAKDAQRKYNVVSTAITETIASAPNSQFWATAEQAKGHTDLWNKALSENLPYLLYNGDPKANGPPTRMGGADVPVALMQEMQVADQELKDVTGIYDAALGERSNEKSGVAISRREQQTQLVNFNFPDNMAKGVQRTWEIFIDLIPAIYDTEQMVRTLGVDGTEDYVKVNTSGIDDQGQPIIVNDLTLGEFDVTVSVGPSFATQRQEASDAYTSMAQADPGLMLTAGDLVYKSMDLPYADEIAERRRLTLPPQIQEHLSQDKKIPPEVQMAMGQVKQMQATVDQHGQLVQQAEAELNQHKSEVEKSMNDLKVAQAQFEAKVSKSLADITMQEAKLTLLQANATAGQMNDEVAGAREALSLDVKSAVTDIQKQAADYLNQAITTLAQIHASSQPQVIVPPPAARARIKHIQRGPNGTLVPVYDDATPVAPTQAEPPQSIQ